MLIFVFISITLGDRSNKILQQFMSKSILLVFSFRSFIVYYLTFRSYVPFEFIFEFIFCPFEYWKIFKLISEFLKEPRLNGNIRIA